MAKAIKLPSGKWQCRGYNNVLKKQRKFSADTKREAERLAAVFAGETKESIIDSTTFLEAAESYIANRSAVLSPSTIAGYTRMLSVDLVPLHDVYITDITSEFLQKLINDTARTHRQKSSSPRTISAKTIKNRYCFITAVVRSVIPGATFSVDIPKRVRPVLLMPSDDEIKRLLDYVEGTEMEVPLLLALFGPLRRGEICALNADHINGNVVHVQYAIAEGEGGSLHRKGPKTAAGDRYITFPDFVIEKLPKEGPVTSLSPNAISSRMPHIMKRIGLPYTFHQLRHWSVSYLHRQGLSDQEILDRAGWESTAIFREVYRHGVKGEDRAAAAFNQFKY